MGSMYILPDAPLVPYPIQSPVVASKSGITKTELKISKLQGYKLSVKSRNVGYYT